MTRQEQLQFCSVCAHRQMDMKQGIICALTGKKADFDGQCPQYELDPAQAAKEQVKAQKKAEELKNVPENPKMKGATLFILVGIVSLINLILELAGVRLIFGLGITTALHELWGTAGIILSAIVSIAFIGLGYLANRKEAEWAYRLAFFAYLADTVLMMIILIQMQFYVKDNIFHLVVLCCTYPLHPFHSKAIRAKAKAETWSPLRVVLTAIMGVLIAGTLSLGLTINHNVRKARNDKPLNELRASIDFMQAQSAGSTIELVGDSAVHIRYNEPLTAEQVAMLRERKELMNVYIKEYLLLSLYGWEDPFLQKCVDADCGMVMEYWFEGEELYHSDFTVKELAAMYLGKHHKTFDSVWKKLLAAYNKCTPIDFDGDDTFKITRAEKKEGEVILYVNAKEKLSANQKKAHILQSSAQFYCAVGNDPLIVIIQRNKLPIRFHFTSDKEPSWSEEAVISK